MIVRRGCKYPERIMNSTKSSTSIMFACTASGKLLPPYVVYKAKHIYDAWTEGGPSNTRYNRTESGGLMHLLSMIVFSRLSSLMLNLDLGKKYLLGTTSPVT